MKCTGGFQGMEAARVNHYLHDGHCKTVKVHSALDKQRLSNAMCTPAATEPRHAHPHIYTHTHTLTHSDAIHTHGRAHKERERDAQPHIHTQTQTQTHAQANISCTSRHKHNHELVEINEYTGMVVIGTRKHEPTHKAESCFQTFRLALKRTVIDKKLETRLSMSF